MRHINYVTVITLCKFIKSPTVFKIKIKYSQMKRVQRKLSGIKTAP